jgi:putative intracellular protease/amidase
MRGHQKVIELRKKGYKPAIVFLNDYQTPAWALDGTTVDISGDLVEGLDLRFLVGLMVSTGATTETRAKAILEACKRAGASVVGVCHTPERIPDRKRTDYVEIWNGPHTA